MEDILKILGVIALLIGYLFLREKFPELKRPTRDRKREGGLFGGGRRYKPTLEETLGIKQTYTVVEKERIIGISNDIRSLAAIHKWNTGADEVKGKFKGFSFYLKLQKFGWSITVFNPRSGMLDFQLKQIFSFPDEEKTYRNFTGDIKFDDIFQINALNPAPVRLFLTEKNREFILRYLHTCTSISSVQENDTYILSFSYPSLPEKTPTRRMLTGALTLIAEMTAFTADVEAVTPFIFENDDSGIQRSFANALFLSFYDTEEFEAVKKDLLDHRNSYVKNLASLILNGELMDAGLSIGTNADMIGDTACAFAEKYKRDLNSSALAKLYPKMKHQSLKKKVLKRCLAAGGPEIEPFCISLLDNSLEEKWSLRVLDALKTWGSNEAVEALKEFKNQTEVKRLDDAADQAITAILHRIDGTALDGRLSFTDIPKNQGGLSVSDGEDNQ